MKRPNILYLRWMQATDDPLLRGPVPAPPGAEVNDPDGLSPNEPTIVVPPSEALPPGE